jgi:hypothetical protein
MTYTTPADQIAPLAEALATRPNVMVPELAKALVALKGRGGARRILELAVMAVEDER